MIMEKGIFVKEIEEGKEVRGVFFVQEKELRTARNGRPYLALALMDSTGSVDAKVWERASELDPLFQQDDYIEITARSDLFRGEIQLNVVDLRRVDPDELDLSAFLPSTSRDRSALWEEFLRLARQVKTPPLSALLQVITQTKSDLSQAYRTAPAAKQLHHAYLGGLLEHAVGVGRLAREVCRLYPSLDRELLLTGALLHDIGKTREIDFSTPRFDYTDEGRLLGHIGLGIEILDDLARKVQVDPSHRRMVELKHLLLSHHGQKEMGSPVLPMMEEAVVLNFLDDLDAKLNYLSGLGRSLEGDQRGWTKYQHLFQRFFFLNPAEAPPDRGDPESKKGEDEEAATIVQQSLLDGNG